MTDADRIAALAARLCRERPDLPERRIIEDVRRIVATKEEA